MAQGRLVTHAVVLLLAGSAGHAEARQAVRTVELHGDVRIGQEVHWTGGHYRIYGNLVLAPGGILTAENCTIELMCSYSREFRFVWEGGTLVTRNATVGGTEANGSVCQTNFELHDGLWEATDTIVRYSYGITFGESDSVGRLRARRLIAGPNPDSVIMTGNGEALIEDSEFAIALTVYAGRGVTRGTFDLPVDRPISATYDGSNMPGARYCLSLRNVRVPLWFLFANGVTMDGPPTELVLGDCPRVIPSILGWNLRGEISLPTPWPTTNSSASLTVGNLTWRTLDKPVGIHTWGLYVGGYETDLVVRGQTLICELMVFGGTVVVEGTEGEFDAATTATTIDVGTPGSTAPARLALRNARVGRSVGDVVRGQVTARGGSNVLIEDSLCTDLLVITEDSGEVAIRGLAQEGELELRAMGGPIRLLPVYRVGDAPVPPHSR